MSQEQFIAALRAVFPQDRLLLTPAALAPYESDALTAFQSRPIAVVIPETQDEVVAAVKACHAFSVPFVARGSGTSLSGGSLPIKEGIVIALNRLARIIKLDPQQRIAVVEPGVINLDITKAAAPYGLLFAPDPSSQPICTIGGNVAFNSGGAHCLKYGMTSNHVLGLKVVLPDGEVAHLGSESLDNVDADMTALFVGCEGLFGIALEITVRLLPKPELYRTVLAAYRSLEAAGDAVSSVIASGLLPGALEIMDNLSIQAAEAAVKPGYPLDAAALLIVELEGEKSQVDAEWLRLKEIIDASHPYQVKVAKNDEERMKIWKGRKSAFSAVGRLSPDYIVQDGVVPRSRLGEALRRDRSAERQVRHPRGECLSRRGWQPAPAHHVQRPRGRRAASRGAIGQRDHRPVHPARRVDHRRARRGHGEARVYAAHVRQSRHGRDVALADHDRPEAARQPRQGFPGFRSAGVAHAGHASAGEGRRDLARMMTHH